MSNHRELLKQANRVRLNQADSRDNLTKEIKRNYDAHQSDEDLNKKIEETTQSLNEIKENIPTVEPEAPTPVQIPVNTNATVSSKGGRPKKYNQPLKKLTIYMPEEYHRFAKENGWKYDGINGFINHLLEEEMKKTK